MDISEWWFQTGTKSGTIAPKPEAQNENRSIHKGGDQQVVHASKELGNHSISVPDDPCSARQADMKKGQTLDKSPTPVILNVHMFTG